MTSCDVAVIGAGAIGASVAYHLAAAGRSVVVLEAAHGPAEGSTGRSFASVRAQWGDALSIELARRSIDTFRTFPHRHGTDVGYRPTGYLFLVPEDRWDAHLAAVERQREHGVRVEVLGLAAADGRTPFDPTGIAGATWGPDDGVVDPHLLTTAYLGLARDRGAQVRFAHRVAAVERHDDHTWTVATGDSADSDIRTRHVVNAAGGWAGEVARLAGFDVPVVHSRRNVYATARGAVGRTLPMTIDLGTGVFLRSEGERVLFGAARPDEQDGYQVKLDWPWMDQVLMMAVPRFPWLADAPLDRAAAWAGTYENTPDRVGIVGSQPGAPTWVNACGFSGHGIMQSPEIGRLVAEQITTGAITSLDASPLRLERFASANPTNLGMVF